ncbi:hypothetical protein M3Y94_00066500 [Aphelenchoides besseyi]|nr:hypothetical protein M3Y94_00066500 [Aphelenchoides besseyi]
MHRSSSTELLIVSDQIEKHFNSFKLLKEHLKIYWDSQMSDYLGQFNQTDFCNCSGENFCFEGLNESGEVRSGFPFDCSLYNNLKALQLLDLDAAKAQLDYKQMVADDKWSPVFIKEVNTWCLVEYRRFDFSKYPSHVKKLMNYAFKLSIIEAFKKYKTFFYFDTSVRIEGRNLSAFLHGVQNDVLLPFSTHTWTGHSVYATTHPSNKTKMYVYFPLPLVISQMEEIQSTAQFISDSPYTRYILKWWYLCALTEKCIDPLGGQVDCKTTHHYDRYRTYMNCHRYDQSFWNIMALTYLFGSERGAVRLNYTKEWERLDESLIIKVEQRRKQSMQSFFDLISIRRNDGMNSQLNLKCQ